MTDSAAPRPSRSFSSGFVSFLGGQSARFLLTFPASILLARILGPAAKGEVALALMVPALIALVANLGLGQAISFLVGSKRHPTSKIIATVVGFWLLFSALLVPVASGAAALGWLSAVAPRVERGLLVLSSLLLPLILGHQYLGYIVLGQQRFLAHNLPAVIHGSTHLLGIVLWVWAVSMGTYGAVLAAIGAEMVVIATLLVLVRRDWDHRPRLDWSILREALSYGFRGQIGNVLQFFNYRLDVVILGWFRDLSEVGLYSLAVSIGEFLWYVPNAGAMVIFPKTAASGRRAGQLTPVAFRIIGVLTALSAAAFYIAAPPAIALVYGADFRGSVLPLFWLLPGIVCLGASKILSADLAGRGRPEINSIGAAISLIVTVALDLLFIPRYGMVGAAAASTLSYLTTLLYTLWAYRQVLGSSSAGLFEFGSADLRAFQSAFERLARVKKAKDREP